MTKLTRVGLRYLRTPAPLDGPPHVLRSGCLPCSRRPRVTRWARLTCAPCWKFYHSPLPELPWRRPWQALTRGGSTLMRATKFTIWWTENDQRSPWEHRGGGTQNIPWDGYPRWVLAAQMQARVEAPRMRCPTLVELPARGRHVAYRGFSMLPRLRRPDWADQLREDDWL